MGHLAFAMYKPKKGKATELKKLLRSHLPLLLRLGLITKNGNHFVESENGTLIEIFEWTDAAAKKKAHNNPAIVKIWEKMMPLCDFPAMKDLPESKVPFPNFKVVKRK